MLAAWENVCSKAAKSAACGGTAGAADPARKIHNIGLQRNVYGHTMLLKI
jgi:hypothetical protein